MLRTKLIFDKFISKHEVFIAQIKDNNCGQAYPELAEQGAAISFSHVQLQVSLFSIQQCTHSAKDKKS